MLLNTTHNKINRYNMIFDIEQRRVGFAESQCKYEDIVKSYQPAPTMKPTVFGVEPPAAKNSGSIFFLKF